jgi:hypothetical protein
MTKRWTVMALFAAFTSVQAQDQSWQVHVDDDVPSATMQQSRKLLGVVDAQGEAIAHTIACKVQEHKGTVSVTQTETNKLIPGIPFVSPNQIISGYVVFEYGRASGETVTNSFDEVQPAAYRLRVSGSGMQTAIFLRRERDSTWGNVLAGEVIAERNSFCLNKLKYLEVRGAAWDNFREFFQKFRWALY